MRADISWKNFTCVVDKQRPQMRLQLIYLYLLDWRYNDVCLFIIHTQYTWIRMHLMSHAKHFICWLFGEVETYNYKHKYKHKAYMLCTANAPTYSTHRMEFDCCGCARHRCLTYRLALLTANNTIPTLKFCMNVCVRAPSVSHFV